LVCIRVGTLIPSMKLIIDWTRGMQFAQSPVPTLAPCVPEADGRVRIWLDFFFIAFFDCNIVVLTLWKAGAQWKSGLTRHRLVSTLYRDGIGYFILMSMVSVTNVVLLNVEHDSVYFNLLILFQRVLHAILSSRIVINVRKALRGTSDPAMVTDPLGHAASASGSQTSGGHLSGRHASGVVVSTSTYKHEDKDAIEMDWAPNTIHDTKGGQSYA